MHKFLCAYIRTSQGKDNTKERTLHTYSSALFSSIPPTWALIMNQEKKQLKLKKISLLAIPIMMTILVGCAAMFHGTSEQVSITSNDKDTKLYVNGAYVGTGNAVTTFKKKNNYVIEARKDGCISSNLPAAKSFDGITLLGVFVDFGIISILVVDGAATGSWQQFDQTNYIIDPHCA
jgi:hypothetical protein